MKWILAFALLTLAVAVAAPLAQQAGQPPAAPSGQTGSPPVARGQMPTLGLQIKDGKVLATWGGIGWGPGQFDWVHGIVVDSQGAVYAADTYGQRIQKFVPPGR